MAKKEKLEQSVGTDVVEALEQEQDEREQTDRLYEQMEAERSIGRAFVHEIDRGKINPNSIYTRTSDKRQILRGILGYKVLYGRNGVAVPIDIARPGRVGNVVRERYKAYQKLIRA